MHHDFPAFGVTRPVRRISRQDFTFSAFVHPAPAAGRAGFSSRFLGLIMVVFWILHAILSSRWCFSMFLPGKKKLIGSLVSPWNMTARLIPGSQILKRHQGEVVCISCAGGAIPEAWLVWPFPDSYVGSQLRCHSQLEHKLKTNFEKPSICFHWAVEAVRVSSRGSG